MDWNNVIEGTISGVVSALIASFIIFLVKMLFHGKQSSKQDIINSAIKPLYKNPFLIALFITSFMAVLTFFSLIYAWTTFNYVYLLIASIVLVVITYQIFEHQCPICYNPFSKKLIDKQTLKEEKRPYRYRDGTVYLYTDGNVKDRKYHGPEKTKMETWRTEKEFYECKSCGHKWDKLFERNLDINNRPKPNVIRTNFRNPNGFN